MPEISRFFGIIIRMYVNEHGVPHFHAYYQGNDVSIEIETGAVLEGSLSPRALRLVREWLEMHRDELLENWNIAMARGIFKRIKPLE